MVISTIEHNGSNIKSFFLLNFIENIMKIKKKKKDDKETIVKLANEISSRLEFDTFLVKPRQLERIVAIYDQGLRSPDL